MMKVTIRTPIHTVHCALNCNILRENPVSSRGPKGCAFFPDIYYYVCGNFSAKISSKKTYWGQRIYLELQKTWKLLLLLIAVL